MAGNARIAVLIPCFNEELTVAKVVRDFRAALPAADIFVFDNNSSDRTAESARTAGARVYSVPRRGKGHVVLAMFQRIEADIYLMVDGDDTYPADMALALIGPVLRDEADMVVGSRLDPRSHSELRIVNRLGNLFFIGLLRLFFRRTVTDVLSGYRAMSRHLVRSIPLFGGGFEIEAELTVKALERGMRIIEVPVRLVERPHNSHSKIRIIQDGVLILSTILALVRDYKPLTIFGSVSVILGTMALFSRSSPLAALAFSLAAVVALACGFVLHSISRHFQELNHRLKILENEVSNHEHDRGESAGTRAHRQF